MTKSGREVELKLAVPDGSVAALTERVFAHGSFGEPARRRHEVTTYFDTPDHALLRGGMSLRVRSAEGGRVQTLKADRKASVAADRAEWEWPIEQETPDLGLLKQVKLAGKLPPVRDLAPVVVTDIDRTSRQRTLDGGTVVEAVLDQGAILAGNASEPVRELELELQAGDPAALYRFALELHAAAPLMVFNDSKAARGYRLHTGAPAATHKVADIVIERKTSASDVFGRIITTELGHLLANQPAAMSGDAEGVHQMRVAIRRLRAALVLFQPHLESHALSRFEDSLQRTGRIFGEARDWDVFCQKMLPDSLQAVGAAKWRDLLEHPANLRRQAAHKRFVQELRSPAFTALVLGLTAWVEDGRTHRALLGDAALKRPIGKLCSPLLDRLANKVERRGKHIAHATDSQRHALRKSLKKLRYAIAYVQSLYPRKSIKSYLRACERLQETLGDINDTVVATALAAGLADETRPDLAPAVGALASHFDQVRHDALHDVAKQWKKLAGTQRFWH